jgi:competence protein ComEC
VGYRLAESGTRHVAQGPHRLIGAGLGWLAGTGWQLQAAALQPWPVRLGVLGGALWVAAGCLGWARWRRVSVPVWRQALLAALLSASLAWCLSDWRAQGRLADRLDPHLEGQTLEIVGRVVGLPQIRADGLRFDFEPDPGGLPSRLRLGWYASRQGATETLPLVQPGQRWRLSVRLKQVHGQLNPHGFDYELLLFEQGIGGTGSVRQGVLLAPPLGWAEGVDRLRWAVREALVQRLGRSAQAGVLAALTVGDQAAIDREDWAVFRLTGVAHLVAISGMHVTMFAWLAAAVLGAVWRRLGRAALWLPAPTVARWGGVLAAAAYALLAGWGVPAQRTVWMLWVVAVLHSRARRWPWPLVLGAAACAVAALDPWSLLQPGFWLSFVAVAVLMAGGDTPSAAGPVSLSRRAVAWLLQALRTQGWVTLALTPLSLLFFQQVSVVGLLANLVAIPVVTVGITPLALLGVLWPPLWSLAAGLLTLGMQGLTALAAWPGAAWYGAVAPGWLWGLALGGLVMLALPWPGRLRALGFTAVLPVLLYSPPRPALGEVELLAADIGQGNAVLLRTAHHTLLYDAGPQYGPDSDAGDRVLLPLLRALGVRKLDLMVLSHRDADHVGGAASLLQALGAWRVHSSLEEGHRLRQITVHQPCWAGLRWTWDEVHFEYLHPAARDLADNEARGGRPNARSCVLKVQARRRSVLLVGDVESLQEMRLLADPATKTRLPADVLLVPHHGSRTSSTPAFIAAVHPKWALVQAGYLNRFGHPAPSVLQRYEEAGVAVVRTDSCGAWHWRSAIDLNWCQRIAEPRYWHHLQAWRVQSEGAQAGASVWP